MAEQNAEITFRFHVKKPTFWRLYWIASYASVVLGFADPDNAAAWLARRMKITME